MALALAFSGMMMMIFSVACFGVLLSGAAALLSYSWHAQAQYVYIRRLNTCTVFLCIVNIYIYIPGYTHCTHDVLYTMCIYNVYTLHASAYTALSSQQTNIYHQQPTTHACSSHSAYGKRLEHSASYPRDKHLVVALLFVADVVLRMAIVLVAVVGVPALGSRAIMLSSLQQNKYMHTSCVIYA